MLLGELEGVLDTKDKALTLIYTNTRLLVLIKQWNKSWDTKEVWQIILWNNLRYPKIRSRYYKIFFINKHTIDSALNFKVHFYQLIYLFLPDLDWS